MNLKSQDSSGTLGLWCRCCGKPLDIMTLGNFPVNNWVSHKKKTWAFKMKRAIKIFMPVQTWYRRRSASVHLAPWRSEVPKNFQVFCFCLSGTIMQKDTPVNNKAISSSSLPFWGCCRKMSGKLLQAGVKGGCVRRAKREQGKTKTHATESKRSTARTRRHRFDSPHQLCLTFTGKYGKWLQMESES